MGRAGQWRAGVTGLPFEGFQSQWVPCIRIKNLGKILAEAEKRGGRVLVRPDHPLSNGAVAVIEDPWGALFMVGTWKSRAGGKERSQ